jgi:hypothetical protein
VEEHIAWNVVSFLIGGIGVAAFFRKGLKSEDACKACKTDNDHRHDATGQKLEEVGEAVSELFDSTRRIELSVVKIAAKLNVETGD